MKKVLLFVEDPGAANYMQNIPHLLEVLKFEVYIYSVSNASKILQSNVDYNYIEDTDNKLIAESLLDRIRPTLVFVGTSENLNTLSFDLIDVCYSRGVPSIGMVDAIANSSFRFRGNTEDALHHAPNYLIVPDKLTLTSYLKLGFPEERISIFMNPLFKELVEESKDSNATENRLSQRQRLGFPLDRDIIVFVSELSTGLSSDQFLKSPEYTLQGKDSTLLRTEVVIEEFLLAVKSMKKKPYLVLRLHPKESIKSLNNYVKFFDKVSSLEIGREVVYCADLVVGMSSVLLQEAFYMGQKVVSILPRMQEIDWLGPLSGNIDCFTNRRDLMNYFETWQKECQKELSSLPYIEDSEKTFFTFIKTILKKIG